MPKKIRRGFTLIEMLIVLGISTLIMSLLLFIMVFFPQNEIKEKAFWRNFDEHWSEAIQDGKNRHQITTVRFRPNDDRIIFEQSRKNNTLSHDFVKLPDGLRPLEYREIMISERGFVRPQTLNWHSNNRKCNIHQKFQLGWGIYYCEDY